MSDWINAFMDYTEGLPTPEIFRLWSGITAVSGILERRVWAKTARSALYPNLYTLLVSPPAVGKTQAINEAKELWIGAKDVILASDSVTKASLIDELAAANRTKIRGTELLEYHTLLVPCGELGVLLPAYDLEFLSNLNNLYDNPRVYRESRRTNNLKIEITQPSLVMLAGTQPGFMASIIPEEGWSMGFMSRMIMIYAGEGPRVSLFNEIGNGAARDTEWKALASGLRSKLELFGCVQWTPTAMAELECWHMAGGPPAPEHSKLQHYTGRRSLHVIKLSIISCASRTDDLVIRIEDVERAKAWLLDAETRMPDVFRQMAGRSDLQVLQELHLFTWQTQQRTGKPVPESTLIHFLTAHAPSDRIGKLLETADRANMISRNAGTNLWTARPKNIHGME